MCSLWYEECGRRHYVRFIAVDMEEDTSDAVSTPTLEMTSAVVERALLNFETLTKAH